MATGSGMAPAAGRPPLAGGVPRVPGVLGPRHDPAAAVVTHPLGQPAARRRPEGRVGGRAAPQSETHSGVRTTRRTTSDGQLRVAADDRSPAPAVAASCSARRSRRGRPGQGVGVPVVARRRRTAGGSSRSRAGPAGVVDGAVVLVEGGVAWRRCSPETSFHVADGAFSRRRQASGLRAGEASRPPDRVPCLRPRRLGLARPGPADSPVAPVAWTPAGSPMERGDGPSARHGTAGRGGRHSGQGTDPGTLTAG